MKFQFKTNINCGGCVAAVTPHLNANSDITSWSVDTQNPSKVLTVDTDNLSAERVKQILEKAGYKAEGINQ